MMYTRQKEVWETGNSIPQVKSPTERSVRTKKRHWKISEKLRRNPGTRARQLAAEAHVSRSTVQRVFKDNLEIITNYHYKSKLQTDNSFLTAQGRRDSKDQSFFWISCVIRRNHKLSWLMRSSSHFKPCTVVKMIRFVLNLKTQCVWMSNVN